MESDRGELVQFLEVYGAKPPCSVPCGKWLRGLMRHGNVPDSIIALLDLYPGSLKRNTLITANRFLAIYRRNGRMDRHLELWAQQQRCRGQVHCDSELGKALVATARRPGAPQVRALAGCSPAELRRGSSVPSSSISLPSETDADAVPLASAVVVNWLYQALLDVLGGLTPLLGGEATFQPDGTIQPPSAIGAIVVMWGTDVGARREQGFLAHDVDIDLAVFLKKGVEWEKIWSTLHRLLVKTNKLKYVMSGGADGCHYRVGPKDPLVIHEFKELKNEIKRTSIGLSRSAIIKEASKARAQGQLASKPHGIHFVDLEVYTVVQGAKQIKINGATPFSVPMGQIFPVVSLPFGPLQVQAPRTAYIIKKEYGDDVLTKRRYKRITGGNAYWVNIPVHKRRCSWPTVQLRRAGGEAFVKL